MRLIKALIISGLLSGCFDDFPGGDRQKSPDNRGTSVQITDHCQTLAAINPIEVLKSELPFALRGFRDECRHLFESPFWQFKDENVFYYQCTLFWSATEAAANDQLISNLNTIAGFDLSSQIVNEGDLSFVTTAGGDVFQTIFFYVDGSTPKYLITQDQLWPLLKPAIETLEDLQWRFELQYENSSLCSATAHWGFSNQQIFVDDVGKCYGAAESRLDNYLFANDGRLLAVDSAPSSENFCQ